MKPFLVLTVGLGLAGMLPAVAVARRSPVVIFLAPLIGAGLAGVAAVFEFRVGGSLPADYRVLAAIVNVGVIAWWLTAGRSARAAPGPGWGWSAATVVVVAGCLVIPVTALRVPDIGGDPNTIWLTHALLAYGGHHTYFTGLRSAAYQFSHPDYPPLVPAVEAVAFQFFGVTDLHLGVDMTLLLTACALAVVGVGIATAGSIGRLPARLAGVAAGGAICLVGFAVSGIDAADGYTDLLYAAAAVSAVIWGLVLPRGGRALAVAWICAAVAGLTKNEGLTTALVILVLIAFRYRPLTMPPLTPRRVLAALRWRTALRTAWRWAQRVAFVAVPALPGLAWAGLVYQLGIRDNFFSASSGQSALYRAGATYAAMAAHLAIAPVAFGVLLAGCLFLRRDRKRARLGNPAWLWVALLGSLAILFETYVIGKLEIHGWLATSVSRTTTFAQVLLYAEIAIWGVLAADGLLKRQDNGHSGQAAPVSDRAPASPQPVADRI